MSLPISKLPIRRVPNTNPPQFEWSQSVPTASGHGYQVIHHRGCAPVAMEMALCQLIKAAEGQDAAYSKLEEECTALKRALLNAPTEEQKRRAEEEMARKAAMKTEEVSPAGFVLQPPKQKVK